MRALSRAAKLLLLLGLLGTAACKSSWITARRAEGFEPTEARPVRVAVLRFEDRSGGTSLLLYPFLPVIWLASAVTLSVPEALPDPEKGADTLRALLCARLRGSTLNVIDPQAVDTRLAHGGWLPRASSMDPKELGRILGADAILFGEVTDWAGHYYGIESRTVVEAGVRLVSTLDGRELYRASIGVSDASGVSGGPTGYVSAAATPLAALGSGPYRDLAIQWSERMGRALVGGIDDSSPAAAPAPAIIAAAVSAPRDRTLVPGDVIDVYALGTPGCHASFDLGTLRRRVFMSEVARQPRTGDVRNGSEAGLYRGAYVLQEGDRIVGAPVVVALASSGGSATLVAQGGTISVP